MSTRRIPYEPSTSGWNVVRYRQRQRRRIVGWSVGGAVLLLAGVMAGLLLTVDTAVMRNLVR